MFTLNQIKEAHSKVQSGADFPRYTKELLELGVFEYSIYVFDGHAEYKGKGNYALSSEAEYKALKVEPKVDIDKFRHYLKIHQQGRTDYYTFCENSAETGVGKWTVDILAKTCTYFDKSGNYVLEEKIPI
ncbi:MAG: DUF1398 domain-containing protein [Dysgonomonas sp.]